MTTTGDYYATITRRDGRVDVVPCEPVIVDPSRGQIAWTLPDDVELRGGDSITTPPFQVRVS